MKCNYCKGKMSKMEYNQSEDNSTSDVILKNMDFGSLYYCEDCGNVQVKTYKENSKKNKKTDMEIKIDIRP